MASRVDISGALRGLKRLDKNVRFAASQAVNRTANSLARAAIPAEMDDSFDRPTRYAKNTFYVQQYSTRDKLVAVVGPRGADSKGQEPRTYLLHHITGGGRRLKRHEGALFRRGLLPPGEWTVPGAGAKLDAYGNMRTGQIVQMLSALKAMSNAGYMGNRTARSAPKASKRAGDFFVGRPGGRAPLGVYQRTVRGKGKSRTNGVKPILIFVRQPRYEAGRFDLNMTARLHIKRAFGAEFAKALASALR